MGPSEAIGACKFVLKQPRRVSALVRAYLMLRTEHLIKLSEAGRLKDRAGIWAAIIVLNVLVIFATQWLLLGGGWNPLDILQTITLTLIASLTLAAPLWGVLTLIRRRSSTMLVANLVALSTLMGTLTLPVSSLVALSAQPARTELPLVRQGLGQSTVAYHHICGPTEELAENLVLGRAMLSRFEQGVQDREKFVALGPSTEHDELFPGWRARQMLEIGDRQLERMKEDISTATRLIDMFTARAESPRAFAQRYPSVIWAAWVLAIANFVIALLGGLHAWKIAVWPQRGWYGKWNAIVGLFAAGSASAVLLVGWIEAARPTTAEAQLDKAWSSMNGFDPLTMAGSESMIKELRATHAELEPFAQSEFQRMDAVCPRLGNHGAWSSD